MKQKQPKLSRESKRAMAARFCENVRRIAKKEGISAVALGRAVDPESSNPGSTGFNLLHRKTLPDDKVICAVAALLDVPTDTLHTGDVEQYKQSDRGKQRGSLSVRAALKETRAFPTPAAPRPESPVEAREALNLERLVLGTLETKLRKLDVDRRYMLLQDVARLCAEV